MLVRKTIFMVTAWLCVTTPFAQTLQMPSNEVINQQKKQISDSMKAMDGKTIVTPTSRSIEAATLGKSYGATADAANDIKGDFKSVSKATREQFEQLARTKSPMQGTRARKGQSDLMIFVSFSMPPDMLTSYVRQAKRFGGVLMMRGFVNDKMSATKAAIERLNQEGVEWQVSPEPFKKFKIEKVPSIVLANADDAESVTADGCATPDAFSMISGDIQVFDALDKMRLRSQPKIAVLAKSLLLADRANGNQGGLAR